MENEKDQVKWVIEHGSRLIGPFDGADDAAKYANRCFIGFKLRAVSTPINQFTDCDGCGASVEFAEIECNTEGEFCAKCLTLYHCDNCDEPTPRYKRRHVKSQHGEGSFCDTCLTPPWER